MNKNYLAFFLSIFAVFFLLMSLSGCTQQQSPSTNPKWVDELINNEQNGPVANPPASLTKCVYRNQIVYYLPSRCCDIMSELYDENGVSICSPDGGFTGRGDGKCLDFFDNRTQCELVWQDNRTAN